jgi:LAS superfamily LD-carboxypeptidase LdcB
MLNEFELTGRARTHVVQREELSAALQRDTLEPFLAMRSDAEREGLTIRIVSAFRDFSAQQSIWDKKYRGERPLYDANGKLREHAKLTPTELVDAIVCWSAVPGGSRHHWGTEIDVIDSAALPDGYRVRLLPEEAAPGGVFYRLHQWLSAHMSQYGFFRPYRTFRGGVHPEPWHLSYAPVSIPALEALTPEVFTQAVRSSGMLGRDLVLERAAELYRQYVINIDLPESSLSA